MLAIKNLDPEFVSEQINKHWSNKEIELLIVLLEEDLDNGT